MLRNSRPFSFHFFLRARFNYNKTTKNGKITTKFNDLAALARYGTKSPRERFDYIAIKRLSFFCEKRAHLILKHKCEKAMGVGVGGQKRERVKRSPGFFSLFVCFFRCSKEKEKIKSIDSRVVVLQRHKEKKSKKKKLETFPGRGFCLYTPKNKKKRFSFLKK